tara:strand:- start:6915 stop:7310 length:396 start_codon:yes stop_codon:yes gene_type:complete
LTIFCTENKGVFGNKSKEERKKMKKLNMLCLAIMAITIGCLGLTNYKQGKRITQLEREMYMNSAYLNDTSSKLEMFLSMIEEEMHSSIRRISRPIAREEVVKGFQQFAENFRKLSEKGQQDEKPNTEIEDN